MPSAIQPTQLLVQERRAIGSSQSLNRCELYVSKKNKEPPEWVLCLLPENALSCFGVFG